MRETRDMETNILEKMVVKEKGGRPVKPETVEEIRTAIAEGFDAYRRRIAEIRSLHGRKAKRSICN